MDLYQVITRAVVKDAVAQFMDNNLQVEVDRLHSPDVVNNKYDSNHLIEFEESIHFQSNIRSFRFISILFSQLFGNNCRGFLPDFDTIFKDMRENFEQNHHDRCKSLGLHHTIRHHFW